ncbi:MAG: molybdopterin-guanine dinucleotide biosynthesis protein B [Chloroflexota bacterium]
MTLPAIAVVGYSDTGKTTVASSLVQTLVARGYRIAAVKHCPHGHKVDRPSTDSARLFAAGADKVVATSPGLLTSMEVTQVDTSLEAIVASLESSDYSYDLVVAEGFKGSSAPKILVMGEEHLSPSPQNVIAIIGDHKTAGKVPSYTFQELDALANQVQDQMLKGATEAPGISLVVDGVSIDMGGFASRILYQVILGFLSTLKNIPPDPQRIRIILCAEKAQKGPEETSGLTREGVPR